MNIDQYEDKATNREPSGKYISPGEFKDVYEQARRIPRGGIAVRGINFNPTMFTKVRCSQIMNTLI